MRRLPLIAFCVLTAYGGVGGIGSAAEPQSELDAK